MERKVLVVCGTVGFLGLLSAALGFAAEATRVKASDVLTRVPGECTYPKSSALYLGLASAISVVIAQAIINTVAGCICCKRNTNPANTNWTVALISFVLSWVTFIIAFLLLLTGSALNDQRGQQRMYFGDYCYVVKPGVFSGGAVLALGSVSLGIVYFVSLQTSKDSQPLDPPHNQGIALGQPQIPPQPVFVHEDTFNRQQIP
ncbi:uncharacterized protein LOC110025693 isoform X1 [Phalaenopsis equestris]|uniref:uncharacterized protein LOC110025693 isoform X1 n=1 Tax=Phalaenopsis equestris TaxID=78828 RepID=UPI0009E47FF9|nr:uncharacterized protein LOC110025693 isoform X1 [Phalaenopsis equestris]